MTLVKRIFQVVLLASCIISCGNDDSLVIAISSPENESIFERGESIQITGTVSDDIEVASITLETSADNLEPFSKTLMGDGSANLDFEFRFEFLELNDGRIYDLEVELTAVDNEGNSTSEKRKILVQ